MTTRLNFVQEKMRYFTTGLLVSMEEARPILARIQERSSQTFANSTSVLTAFSMSCRLTHSSGE